MTHIDLPITGAKLTAARDADRRKGLLGFVSFVLGGAIAVDGVALRRTRDGRLVLSFPVRHDSQGRQLPILRPTGNEARAAIEAAVLQALGLETEGAR